MTLEEVYRLDEERTRLACSGQLKKLRKTYAQELSVEDINTRKFWKKTLLAEKNVDKDYMRKDRVKTVASMIRKNIDRLLNIGVGDGELETLVQNVDTLVGIDITVEGLEKARKKSLFEAVCGSIYSLPIKGEFDTITVLEVLEHLPSNKILNTLLQIKRLLVKSGDLIISVPVNENYGSDFNPNGHLRRYSEELIVAELEMSGFKIEEVETLSAFEHMYLLKKILSKTILRKRWKPNVVIVKASPQ